MLTKEQFVNAMCFFDDYDRLSTSITEALSPFFDGNGFLFIGNDILHTRYLNLLKAAMNIDPEDEYDPISMWLYDASTNIYSEPDENGICKKIGESDHIHVDVRLGDQTVHITNTSELYDYIVKYYS